MKDSTSPSIALTGRRLTLRLRPKKMFRSIAVILAMALAFCAFPFKAIAYSGAGGECGNSAIEKAAMHGTADEITIAIDSHIARLKDGADRYLAPKKFLGITIGKSRRPIPNQQELRRIAINGWNGCEGHLLDYAVAAGNVAVIDRLLEMGADPNGRLISKRELQVAIGYDPKWLGYTPYRSEETTFMRCRHVNESGDGLTVFFDTKRSAAQRAKALNGYAHLIKRGADVNFRSSDGQSALERCMDVEIVQLLLNSGADPNRPACRRSYRCESPSENQRTNLDIRVEMTYGSYLPATEGGRENQIELLNVTIPYHKTLRLAPDTEFQVCIVCNKPENSSLCKTLREKIKASNSLIFEPGKPDTQTGRIPNRHRQCGLVRNPECEICKKLLFSD